MFKLICVEGVDGSGKSSLINRLINEQNEEISQKGLHEIELSLKKSLTKFAFPSRWTKYGKEIGKYLKECEEKDQKEKVYIHKLFHLDRVENKNRMEDNLMYQNIIIDRYDISGKVYAELDGIPNGHIAQEKNSILKPDLYIYIDVNPISIIDRLYAREQIEIFESLEKQLKVYRLYKKHLPKNTIIIDGNRDFEDVFKDFKAVVNEFICKD